MDNYKELIKEISRVFQGGKALSKCFLTFSVGLIFSCALIIYSAYCMLGIEAAQSAIIPVFFGSITALFSFLAYQHTREKFRLELYEKR